MHKHKCHLYLLGGPVVDTGDEAIRRLEHVETLLLMGDIFPDDKEILAIKKYLTMAGRGETEFIPLEEIDNEL